MNLLKHSRYIIFFLLSLSSFCSYAQVCKDSTELYGYISAEPLVNRGNKMVELSNGNIATFGHLDLINGGSKSIVLTDASGRFLKGQYFSGFGPISLSRMAATPDGGLMLFGTILSPSSGALVIILIRLSNQLDIVWSKILNGYDGDFSNYPLSLHCDEDGTSFISCMSFFSSIGQRSYLFYAAIDKDGNSKWHNVTYNFSTYGFSNLATTTIGNKVCFMGTEGAGNGNSILLNYVFEKQTGNFISLISNQINDVSITNLNSYWDADNFLVNTNKEGFYLAIPARNFYTHKNSIFHLFIDSTLNLQTVNKIEGIGYTNPPSSQFFISKNGELTFTGGQFIEQQLRNFIGVVDIKGNVIVNKILAAGNYLPNPTIQRVILTKRNNILLSISDYPTLDTIMFADIDLYSDSTMASCLGKDSSFFSVTPIGFSSNKYFLDPFDSEPLANFPVLINSTDFFLEKKEYCNVTSTCSTASIEGNAMFCTGTLQTFSCKRNAGCYKKIVWQTDLLPATIVAKTDSTISLVFNKSWQGKLLAKAGNCEYAKDSIEINVFLSANDLTIGADTAVCPGQKIVVKAQNGFAKYTWNTGETTNSINVADTGFYSVEVIDFCGNMKSDTIHVSAKTPLFPVVELGANQTICLGKTISLSVVPGYASYLWSTAEKVNAITVNLPGNYSVTVKDVCGNEASDFIEILQPGKLYPQFSLGNDTVICSGASLHLSTPVGFASYVWNTGEIAENISIKKSGKYFVTVKDVCGNSFSDTIFIKAPDKIFPVLADKTICFKDSLFMAKEAGFHNYNWQPSAGFVNDKFFLSPAVTTNYKVSVLDSFNCYSERNFVLTVEKCVKKLWMPTGFTPNNDGLNDELGPKVEGRLQSYSFKVFNRWGEMVFSSNNPNSKWNGKLHSADAPIGLYVWMCNYQFRNEEATMEKGTVTLIR